MLAPAHRRLWLPGRPKRRLIREPDLRHLDRPRLSGSVVDANEIDFDELRTIRSWRTYDHDTDAQVRYFMWELAQRNPGEEFGRYFKAVRFIRLRRVPRYMRQQGSGVGRPGVGQMAYVLSALREQGILFCQIVAKTPDVPLVYAYGVQAVGDTAEEAQQRADEAHAALCALLDGTFQQIEYTPLSMHEGESLIRYSSTWNQIAVARGRPMPTGEAVGASALLDGNRTDIEQTHNQMESFLRGMSEMPGGFMLNLITVPVSVEAMTLAWRNITEKLTATSSEIHGSKSFNFGAALPLSVGNGQSHGTSDSHSTSDGRGESVADGISHSQGVTHTDSVSDSLSASHTAGTSQSVSESQSASQTLGTSESVAHGVTHSAGVSESVSATENQSASESLGQSTSLSHSAGEATGQTVSHGVSQSESQSVGVSESASQSSGVSAGLSQSESVGTSQSLGTSVGSSTSVSQGASLSNADSISQSAGQSLSQSTSLSQAIADTLSRGHTLSEGAGFNGGLFGIGGSTNATQGATDTSGTSNTETFGTGLTGGNTTSVGVGATRTEGLSAGIGSSDSVGLTDTRGLSQSTSLGESFASSQSVGLSHGINQSLGASQGVSQSLGLSQSASRGVGLSEGASFTSGLATGISQGQSAGVSQSQSQSATTAVGTSASETIGASRGVSAGVSQSDTIGVGRSVGTSVAGSETLGASSSAGMNRATADAYMVGMSRQASSSGSIGIAPSMGVSVAKQTLDVGKETVAAVMRETMKRYIDGLEGGAYMYQMFLVAPDRATLAAGSALLKAAFWGPGNSNDRLGQPFHIINDFEDEDEQQRLLDHARAFSSYRRREPSIELIEPFMYSSYATVSELSAFARPPVAENLGLLAVHDSAPVMAMPDDRANRDINLGYVYNGERGRVSKMRFGVDVDELTHVLLTGQTGVGKTTTLLRFLSELVNVKRTIVDAPTPQNPIPRSREVPASILAVDWMRNMRHLGSVVEPVKVDPVTGERTGRFQFFSVRDSRLGAFRWNPFEIPSEGMSPVEWLNAMADNMVASWNLGEFGRSLISEYIDRLYRANRLEPFTLREAKVDQSTGQVLRPAIVLDPIDPSTLPPGAVGIDEVTGEPVASVYTCSLLSRLVGVQHLAVIVAAELEAAATVEGGRAGTSIRDRLQSLWRRVSYFAPGGQMDGLIGCDDDLTHHTTLGINDLVDPDAGLVTVIETDGLDLANRRFILGSVLLALYRCGLHDGEGHFNQQGRGTGLFVVLEEAHELFGSQGEDEDTFSASTRTALYESMHRRIRALGARLIDVVQNPGDIPEAVTSNTATVIVHRANADADRRRIFSLLNWSNQIGQQLREYRFLGELPVGHAIMRMSPQKHFLEAAPINFVVEPAALGNVTDDHLAHWASRR